MRSKLLLVFLLGTACAPAKSEPAARSSGEVVAAEDPDRALDEELSEAEAVHEKDPTRAAHMASEPCRHAVENKTKARCFNLGVIVK